MKTKATKVKKLDPLNIPIRLYRQVGELLTQLEQGENITLRERVQALIAVGRLMVIFDKRDDDDEHAGSTARKYQSAFAIDGTRRGKTHTGPPVDDRDADPDWFESAEIDDGTKWEPSAS